MTKTMHKLHFMIMYYACAQHKSCSYVYVLSTQALQLVITFKCCFTFCFPIDIRTIINFINKARIIWDKNIAFAFVPYNTDTLHFSTTT